MPKRRVVRHEVTQPLNESYRLIPLTQGQNAIVDAEDFEWLSQWTWQAIKRNHIFYVSRTKHAILMHREILKCSPDEKCDHRNHNGLDNRKNNLRKCTQLENIWNSKIHTNNTSGYIGVYFAKYATNKNKWRATINNGGRQIQIGYFATAKEAAKARDVATINLHGEFAVLNFPLTHSLLL